MNTAMMMTPTDEDALPIGVGAHEHEAVPEYFQDHGTDEDAEHRALAAGERGAPDDRPLAITLSSLPSPWLAMAEDR